jgi:Leucine-rich repeat (LRR) protein
MGSNHATSKRSRLAAIGLVTCVLVAAVDAGEITLFEPAVRGGGTKVLHFPPDQYVGNLIVAAKSVPTWDPRQVGPRSDYVQVIAARGDVTVPRDRAVSLGVCLRARPEDLAGLSAQDRQAYQKFAANRIRLDPQDLAGLSALGPDDLYSLSISTEVPRRDADSLLLEPIRRLTGLQSLSLNNTGVTAKGMENLRALRSLKVLHLFRWSSIGNAGLAVLKDLPALEYLELYTGVTDAGLKQVAQAGSIRWLQIRTGGFWGPGLAELAQMPRLERLCLWGNVQITDRHIAYLESLTQIKGLTLWGSACDNLTDASLAAIGKLKNLEELYFIMTSPRFTPAGIAHLKDLKKLRKVDFSGAWVVAESVGYGRGYGDDAMRQLAAVLPDLESLEGAGILSAEGVKALATFRNLRVLDLTLKDPHFQRYYGPTGFSHLRELRSLEELRVNGEALSDADLTCIESLDHLKVLSIMSTEVTDRGLASIRKLKQLEQLSLDARVSRGGLNQLNDLAHLQALDVGIRPDVQPRAGIDELTLDLSGLQNLKDLRLTGLPLQDADMAFLAKLRHLESLNIYAPSLPPSSLRHLSGLSELKRLWVSGLARPADQDLAPLANLANVTYLDLAGDIPDAALSTLGRPAGLQSLTVHTPEPIRSQTIADLKQRLPTIEYIRIMEPYPQPTVSPQRPGASPPRRNPPAAPTRPRRR